MLQEFKDFIMKGNLIDLAIAVVLATFFAPVISSIVQGVVLNLLAAIVGKPSFDDVARLKVKSPSEDNPTGTYLEFGQVITAVVTFVLVGLVCFLIVKAYNKLTNKVDEAAGPTEVDLLTEIRDSLANR
jgi:large conductance mechanosensitive channel